MFKKVLAGLLACVALAASAVEINKADQAELQTVPGIGASIAGKVLAERKNGEFKSWPDLIDRVPGVGPKSAARLSAHGLTVNGATYDGAAAAPDAKPKVKPKAAKPEKAAKE